MTTDKTGAQTNVTEEADRFTISLEDRSVGFAQFAQRDGQRVFFHTEVDDQFEGRGLATILIGEALSATKETGLRIVPVCELVAAYCAKHPEFNDIVDPPITDIRDWLRSAS
jgi:predicted GNAT family acetyltransferase